METTTAAPTIFYAEGYPPLPELNSEQLFQIVRWAEADEKDLNDPAFAGWGHWSQGSWARIDHYEFRALTDEERRTLRNGSCQTSYCIAGQAVFQAGYRMNYMSDGYANQCVLQRPTSERDPKGAPIWQDVPGASLVDIERTGAQVLGLTDDEADLLFNGDNELEDIKKMANLFALARHLPPMFADAGIYQVGRGQVDHYWLTESDEDDD